MTADYTIEATPGQVAAIKRDGFLVAAGPTEWVETILGPVYDPVPATKPCPECRGSGWYSRWRDDVGYRTTDCPTCNGDGTVPIVVEVVVPARPNAVDSRVRVARTLLRGTAEAVPVASYPSCEPEGGCVYLNRSPYPDIILCPEDPWLDRGRHRPMGQVRPLGRSPWRPRSSIDVTHHFADVPRPEVGDTAWIIRGEGS